MLQLRQHLTGDALKAIEGFQASDIGYDAALKRLDDKFGGPRRAILMHLETIQKMTSVNFNDLKKFEEYVDTLELCILSLQESGRTEEFHVNSMLFSVVRSKLSPNILTQFKRWASFERKIESLLTLKEWLSQEVRHRIESQEEVEGFTANTKISVSSSHSKPSPSPAYRYPHYNGRNSKTYATVSQNFCIVCGQFHENGINNCAHFRTLSVAQRWEIAKVKRLCFRCLGDSHRGNRCTAAQQCKIDGCRRTHHYLLHGGGYHHRLSDSFNCNIEPSNTRPSNTYKPPQPHHVGEPPRQPSSLSTVGFDQTDVKHTHTQVRNLTNLVMRVIPVVLRNHDRVVQCNALMDDCSTDSYINANVAAELGLKGEITDLDVSVLGGRSTSLNAALVSAELCSLDFKTCIPFTAFTVDNVTGGLRTVDWNHQANFWPHLKGIPFPQITGNRVDLLIGLNVSGVHRSIAEIPGLYHEPVARLTLLGWTCIGPAGPARPNGNFAHFTYHIKTESDVDSLIRNMWDIEKSGLKHRTSDFNKSELDVIDSTERSLLYDANANRYTVGIPWNSNYRKVLSTSNIENAESRLISLERSLAKKPEVAETYSNIIQQHLLKGYITEIPNHSLPSWYLPHFAVVRMDKTTTKVRMVLDAAARTEGLSLNDCINPGPKLQRDLVDVILRFRSKPIALASDISEMFLQIGLKAEDRVFHRFLWRDNLDERKPIKIYQFNRLVFGNSSSPYLSQEVIRHHCEQNKTEFPLASESVLNSMYVDDLLDSVDTISEAIDQLTSQLQGAGFEIRKWLSNKTTVLEDVPVADRLNKLSLDDENLPSIKTLGILWCAETDSFTFEVAEPPRTTLTKRIVVSKTATLFDPLNLIAPFTIRAKLGIQKTWVRGLDWDTNLPADLTEQWTRWFSELPLLQNIDIPRCLVRDELHIENKTLHVFVDASEKSYATCCYLRCEYADRSVSVVLIVAKTRVAPLKTISIPKLELCGAVLGMRLAIAICEVLNISKTLTTFWCDSQNVLYWIKGESRTYKPFVSHRVGEIHVSSEPLQWRYVPTKLNSADLATRGLSAVELATSDLWWHGPEFLSLNSSLWPDRVIPEPADIALAEVRTKFSDAFLITNQANDLGRLDPTRYSKWSKLVRVTAWILRFINNVRDPKSRVLNNHLSALELEQSKIFWYKTSQWDAFKEEILRLRKGNPIPNGSKLLPLHPTIDKDGLLRVDGRLGKAEHLSFNAKFPIILSGNHVISRHIATSYHEDGNHEVGVSHTLSLLRSKYWIILARKLIKSIKSNCAECIRRRKKPAVQVMAPLPAYRLGSPLRAFARVGVDYAGPFYTKQGRGRTRTKRYLCVITCLASRAVHLEMAWSLDSESFLCAFSRFTNRRGKPISVVFDNGSNFIGAESELGDLIRALDQTKIGNSLANSSIEWKFNPPLSPHFGGVFESMVKSSKRAIKAVIGDADVTDEELITVFVKAEGLINSRPLGYQGDNPNDIPVLTQNHLLFGQLSGQLVPECVDDFKFDPRKRWRRVQELVKHFWQRWMKEILPTLNARSKWHREQRDFQGGDVAVVVDSHSPEESGPWGGL